MTERDLATYLADCLDDNERNVLGPTDSRLCSKALRYWASARVRRAVGLVATVVAVAAFAAAVARADFDGDGRISLRDVHVMLDYVAGSTRTIRTIEVDGNLWRVEYEHVGGIDRVIGRRRLTDLTKG